MIKIEITGDTADDVFAQLTGLVGRSTQNVTLADVSVEIVEDENEAVTEKATKKPPVKKSPEKAKEPEKKPEPEPVTEDEEAEENTKAEDADEEQTEVTYEDLQKAMLRLTKAYSLDRSKAAGILQHFGVGHGADLKKSDYPEAFKMAEDLIAKASK